MMILNQHSIIEFESSMKELQTCISLLDNNRIEYEIDGYSSECPDYIFINLDMTNLGELMFLVDENIITEKSYECIFNSEVSGIRIHHNLLV